MKEALSIIAVACLFICSCKKKEQAGSPYTKQLADTRNFVRIDYRSVAPPTYTSVTATDTVSVSIIYVNDATITFNSTRLTYDHGISNDDVCGYVYNTDDYPSYTASLRYDHVHNSISFRSDSHISAAGNYWTSYQSF